MDVEGFRGIEPYHMLKPTRKRDPHRSSIFLVLRSFSEVGQNTRIVLGVVGRRHVNERNAESLRSLSRAALLVIGNDCNDFGIQVLARGEIFKSRATAILGARGEDNKFWLFHVFSILLASVLRMLL